MADLEQAQVSSPWLSFGTSCVKRESDRSVPQKLFSWPLWGLKPVCTGFPVAGPPVGLAGPSVKGKREGLIQFPSFEVKNGPEWRSSWSKALPNDKEGGTNSPGSIPGIWGQVVRGLLALWMGAFVPTPFDNKNYLKQLHLAISNSDWFIAMGFKLWYASESPGEWELPEKEAWFCPSKIAIPYEYISVSSLQVI